MKIELNTYEAADILLKDEYAKWSREAALALVEYYEALEEDCGESIELDAVAIRCEWTEYACIEEAVEDYDEDFAFFPKPNEAALAYFEDHTTVIVFEGGVLIQQF